MVSILCVPAPALGLGALEAGPGPWERGGLQRTDFKMQRIGLVQLLGEARAEQRPWGVAVPGPELFRGGRG